MRPFGDCTSDGLGDFTGRIVSSHPTSRTIHEAPPELATGTFFGKSSFTSSHGTCVS